jgi:two-component system phosphate regulon response regulator PhoB
MTTKHILVVEDEEDIQELISYNLRKENYQVDEASSGEEAIAQAKANPPDLILLDLMLPGIDGFEVCRRLKSSQTSQTIPIIMLTAKGAEADIVTGLELGAVDYITKPFSPRILIARVRAVLRRQAQPEISVDQVITRENLIIDPDRHQVSLSGNPIQLTATEFKILHLLATKPGWVYSRDQIVSNIHQTDFAITARAIDVQVVGLRKKLGNKDKFIETVRGVGYRFKE